MRQNNTIKAPRLGRREEGENRFMTVKVWMQGWQNALLNWWRLCNCRASNLKPWARRFTTNVLDRIALRKSPPVGVGTGSGKGGGPYNSNSLATL